MRVQLMRLALVVAVLLAPALARADGELSMRGVYYKEKATRVIQPMLDGRFEVGDSGTADSHVLIDAITSASVAAGILEEERYEVGGGYLHQLTDGRLGGQARVSYEPDYMSVFAGLRGELELFDKNFVIGAAVGYGHDWIDNSGDPTADRLEDTLDTFLGSLSASQLLSPDTVVAVTYDLIYLSGQQANLYRLALTEVGPRPETHPDERMRHAVAFSARHFVARTETTAIASYRLYGDDWGIWAHTPEVRVDQAIGESIQVGAGYRFQWQNAADFYRPSYTEEDVMELAYLTDDVKLSRFTTHAVTARGALRLGALGFGGTLAEARAELVLEYIEQNNRFGNAGVAYGSLTVPFQY
jgi:hypothetical protein